MSDVTSALNVIQMARVREGALHRQRSQRAFLLDRQRIRSDDEAIAVTGSVAGSERLAPAG